MELGLSGPGVSSNTDDNQKLRDSITPTITNVVSGFDVKVKLDPKDISRRAFNAEYNEKKFNAVVMRIKAPKTTALIFPSGKIIVTGAKTVEDSKLACRKFARILQKLDYNPQFKDWKVVNIVGLMQVPFPLSLALLQCNMPGGKWEPELFPGLITKIREPKMTLLVFQSGKIVALGFKAIQDLDGVLDQIFPVLLECKKNISP